MPSCEAGSETGSLPAEHADLSAIAVALLAVVRADAASRYGTAGWKHHAPSSPRGLVHSVACCLHTQDRQVTGERQA